MYVLINKLFEDNWVVFINFWKMNGDFFIKNVLDVVILKVYRIS